MLHCTIHLSVRACPAPVALPPAKSIYTTPIMLNSLHWCHHSRRYVCMPFACPLTFSPSSWYPHDSPCRPTSHADYCHWLAMFPTAFSAMVGDQRNLIETNPVIPKLSSHEIIVIFRCLKSKSCARKNMQVVLVILTNLYTFSSPLCGCTEGLLWSLR